MSNPPSAAHTVNGENAVVTSASEVAAGIGRDVLGRGGNVYDAVVAMALAETVLLPPKCGLAGDIVAIVMRAGQPAPQALVSVGPAPRRLAQAIEEAGSLPATGGLSVGIPGAPAGFTALLARATMSRAQLAAPAIRLAREGFAWPMMAARLTRQSQELLREQNPDGVVYLPGGQPAEEGTRTTLPGLADVLDEFVARGGDLFAGPLGDVVIDRIVECGGIIERDELTSARAEWLDCETTIVDGTRVWATPLPTHGRSLLDAVSRERSDSGQRGLVRACEDAVAARQREHGDAAHGGGTSVVTAADSAGNAVVLVHSNSFQKYGSGIVVPGYGLVLSNRPGRGFTAVAGHPNYPAAGKRPVTTLHAWAVRRPDGAVLLGATPGGENQMRWNAQCVAAAQAGVDDPGEIVSAPRWGRFAGTLTVEEGFTDHDRAGLADGEERELEFAPRLSLWSAQQVIRMTPQPTGHFDVAAAADPRTAATAYGV